MNEYITKLKEKFKQMKDCKINCKNNLKSSKKRF